MPLRARLASTDPIRLAALAQHGRTLAAMKRFAEAEPELLEAYEGAIESRGSDHGDTKQTVKALAELYDAWHDSAPDQGHDAKAAEWRARLDATSDNPVEEATAEGEEHP